VRVPLAPEKDGNTLKFCSLQDNHPAQYKGCITDAAEQPCTNFPL
jgi:hypothetical protein